VKQFVKMMLGFCVAANASGAMAIEVGGVMPSVTISSMSAGDLNNQGMQKKISILNFWATWCAACKVELKEMASDFKELANDKNVQFAFVALDKEPEAAATWMKENMTGQDVIMRNLFKDPDFKIADLLGVDSFPMTVVVGGDGKILYIQRGFKEGEGSTAKIVALVKKSLPTR